MDWILTPWTHLYSSTQSLLKDFILNPGLNPYSRIQFLLHDLSLVQDSILSSRLYPYSRTESWSKDWVREYGLSPSSSSDKLCSGLKRNNLYVNHEEKVLSNFYFFRWRRKKRWMNVFSCHQMSDNNDNTSCFILSNYILNFF